jgi:SHS2 domain-containing protein
MVVGGTDQGWRGSRAVAAADVTFDTVSRPSQYLRAMMNLGHDRFGHGATMHDRIPPSHEVVDHTSEIRLRIRAGSLAELLAEAGRALARLELRGGRAVATGDWRPLTVSAADRAALLVAWLNELVFLAEAERWVPIDFEIGRAEESSAGESAVWARARGMSVDRSPGLVKAATLHGLRVDAIPGGLEGEVVLDV